MSNPAIVVIAYNREKSLQRLLNSIARVNFPSEEITLHISIDASDNELVSKVANAFEWKFGEKIIDLKSEKLGLFKHVIECGNLTEKYGSIIVLEDDVVVAPGFYRYAQKADHFYCNDEQIAGVSLFTYPCEENNFYPFQPIKEDSDVHFIQVASSWGQLWNNNQWSKFKSWLTENPTGNESLLPGYIINWGSDSWKKRFINYMLDSDRYFVFPNTSYTTNFEDEGTHASKTGLFQVQLDLVISEPRFCTFSDSNSIYDVYFELIPSAVKRILPQFSAFDFDVDFYATKPVDRISSPYVLTSRRGKSPIEHFGSTMSPLIQNVLFEIEGTEIGFYSTKNLLPTEKNRFLSLTASPVQLNQFGAVRSQLLERVTLIIPVLEEKLLDLKTTFSELISDQFYDCSILLVCSDDLKEKVQKIIELASVSTSIITSISQNLDQLLQFGISSCRTEYCGWMQAGMTISPKELESVARIFREMAQVQILRGVEEKIDEKNYVKLNTSNYRWTAASANLRKEDAAMVRSEFVFWRKSLLPVNVISRITCANLFIELLKLNPIYVLGLNLGSINGKEVHEISTKESVGESLKSPEFKPKGGLRSVIRPLFRVLFKSNIPYFRLFYKEMEQLPMVIRYDFKNDSFYLDNY